MGCRLGLRIAMTCVCALALGGTVAFAGNGTSLPSHAELTVALDNASAAGVNNGGIFHQRACGRR
ncbi:MAG: hypothetical protein ACPGYT_12175 [Nitrospirales bacterium]